jgi:hypothetical protein
MQESALNLLHISTFQHGVSRLQWSCPNQKIELDDTFVEREKGIFVGKSELRMTPGNTYTMQLDVADYEVKNEGSANNKARSFNQKGDLVITSTRWDHPIKYVHITQQSKI